MTRLEQAVAIAREHIAWRQRSRSGGTSYRYCAARHMVLEDFGIHIRHDGQAKRVAIAIYAAKWLELNHG